MPVRRFPLIVMTLVIAGSAVLGAQSFMRRSRAPLREPTPESFDGVYRRSQKPQRRRLDDGLPRR
jgi:hypothetical protein